MAKHKGKSKRRIKDWHLRYRSGEAESSTDAHRGKLSQRAVKLPPSRLSEDGQHSEVNSEVNVEGMPQAEGMVVGLIPPGAVVRVGADELLCGIAKAFRAPEAATALAVGDDVTIALTRPQHADAVESDRDRADGMILSRQPRETALARPRPRSGKRRDRYDDETFDQVIAANMDVLLIVASAREPPLRHGLIDRYLIIAERGELTPILVVNKIDLGWRNDAGVEAVLSDFKALEIEILTASALTGEGLEALQAALTGKRSVLAGASGVGKTTLINAMIPDTNAATRTVRGKDKRGRHTTSAAVVYELPGGGMIVDTPGIRELGMMLDADELPWYFPEIEQIAPDCRFNDCTHTHEPNCAVLSAVERGQMPRRRYVSYLRLLETLGEA